MENIELLKRIKFHMENQKKGWKNLIYGLGELYQSFDELNIKGKRNTKKRIEEYELKKYLNKNCNVLDIGCNCGFISLQISPHVNSVEGVEVNPYLVEIANEVKKYLNINNVNFNNKGFENYKTDKKYETVFSFAADKVADELSPLHFIEYIEKVCALMTNQGYLFYESQASDIIEGTWYKKYNIIKKYFKIIKEKKIFSDYPLHARQRVFLILQKL